MRCPLLSELPEPPKGKTGWPWTDESSLLPESMADGFPWPKITIVTPSFNQGQFIEETIRSVLLQGYPNLDYIIMDGGSSDDTLQIIQKYKRWLAHWVSSEDDGQSEAINQGWKKGGGDILAWLNSDDTYCPGALCLAGQVFGGNTGTMLLSGAGNTTDVSGTKILSVTKPSAMNPYDLMALYKSIPNQPSVFIAGRVLADVGFLDPRLRHVMDWEFWIRIGLYYKPDRIKKTNTVLSNFRKWGGTKTSTGLKRPVDEIRMVLDSVFEAYGDDERLLRIKKRSFSAMYRSQATRARSHLETTLAVKSLVRAWLLAPNAYHPWDELFFFLSVVVGKRKRNHMKDQILSLLRSLALSKGRACKEPFQGSSHYWENRYEKGGDSGVGSYGRLANYKAQVVNSLIKENDIQNVIEFGCGDGHQLSLYEIPDYTGIDVSKSAISMCKKKFRGDSTKRFFSYREFKERQLQRTPGDLTISLDVIYHLVEDPVFEKYIQDLFDFADRYVLIYSTNFDRIYGNPHQIDRHFTPYIKEHIHDFNLMETIVNSHKGDDTMSDFFVYKKFGM